MRAYIILHLVDSESEDPSDSLHKISSLLDDLAKRVQQDYTSEQNIAVDEYLLLWKGRPKFWDYITSKRQRYDVKTYMLCKHATGYLHKSIVNAGKNT